MNIFITNNCPIKSAEYLDDNRASKMLLESAQLLSAAIWLNGGESTYKLSHKGHPCTKWAAETRENYMWLYRHYMALCKRFVRDRGKTHKSQELALELMLGAEMIPSGKLTPFPNCAANETKGISFKHIENVHEAYKLYLDARWKTDTIKLTWNGNAKRI